MRRLSYSLIVIVARSSDLQLSMREYLERSTTDFMRNVEQSFGSENSDATNLVAGIRESLLNSLTLQEMSLAEVNQLVQVLEKFKTGSDAYPIPKNTLDLALAFLPVAKLGIVPQVNESMNRVLKLAKRIGLTQSQAAHACHFFSNMEPSDFEDRMELIDARIADYLENSPRGARVPEDLRTSMGLQRTELGSFKIMGNRYRISPPLNRLLGSQYFTAVFERIMQRSVTPRVETALGVALEGLELVAVFYREGDEAFESPGDNVIRAFKAFVRALDETDEVSDTILGDLARSVQTLREIADHRPTDREQKLLDKLVSVESEARLILIPGLCRQVKRLFSGLQPHSFARLDLFAALVEASIQVVTDPALNGNLVALASFWGDMAAPQNERRLLSVTNREENVLHYSFEFTKSFGIQILDHLPHLLPDWSSGRRVVVREIIETLVYFDGPKQWKNLSIASDIVDASDERLSRGGTVLKLLPTRQNLHAPLVDPGVWLHDFLQDEPEKYTMWVADSVFLPLQDVSEGFPRRFMIMAHRIYAIPRLLGNRGGNLSNRALKLPEQILRWEVESGCLFEGPVSSSVQELEEAVLAFFNLIERVEIVGFEKLTPQQQSELFITFNKLIPSANSDFRAPAIDQIRELISRIEDLERQIRDIGSSLVSYN